MKILLLNIILIILIILEIVFLVEYDKQKNSDNISLPNNIYIKREGKIVLPDIEPGKNIPKIFHRTHNTKEVIDNFKDVENKIKDLHPDYEIINYTEEDRIKFIKVNYNKRVLTAYKSIKNNYGAARADFFRYLVIYIKGGVYLDIKSRPKKNIDPLLQKAKDRILISRQGSLFNSFWSLFPPYGECIQWCIVSPKGHLLLKEVILQCIQNIENDYGQYKNYKGAHGVISMTGPVVFTYVYNKFKNNYKTLYLKPNFDSHFDKNVINYDKKELNRKFGIKDYYIQTDNIVEYVQN